MVGEQNRQKFAWRSFLMTLATIGIPIALQNLLTTTASMVDTMMIAPLGELSVGALGLCAQFSTLMFTSYSGTMSGGMLFISQYWGSKEDDGIERSYGMMLVCMMVAGLLFGGMAIVSPGTIMRLYTDKPNIQQIGEQYLHIVGVAYILQVLSMAMSTLLRSTERVRIPMIASFLSVGTNLFLNWVFIYGNLGCPALGVRGAALATTCAAGVNAIAICVMARATGYPYLFHVRNHFKWTGAHFKAYFFKSLPIICNEFAMGVANMVVSMTMGRQPEYVIAAYAVFRTLEGFTVGFFYGFSNAASIVVGKCVGAGELDTAYERGKRLVFLCSGFIFATNMVLLAFNRPLLTRMSLSGDSYEAGLRLLTIFVFVAIIRMANWIQNDTYRASGDPVYGTVLEIVFMYVLVLPCTLVAAFVLHMPYWVIFLCNYIDEPIRFVLMQIHMYSGRWIKPVTDLGQAALPAFRRKHDRRAAGEQA